jgi:trimeric autotransporter adhesin
MKAKNITTRFLRKPIGRSPCRPDYLAILLALVYFAFSQGAQALLPAPTPDGGYTGWNTAEGSGALFNVNVASGTFNTAIGGHALYLDTTGQGNTAVGAFALAANISGNQNVAVGRGALQNNTGSGNVAVGFQALFNNTTSSDSSQAFGNQALFHQRDGTNNNGFGWHALYNNVSGDNNTVIGHAAGLNITGNGNVDIGAGVGGVAGENDTTRIKNIYSSVASGRAVYVNSDNKIGTLSSSRRYKEEIKPMDKASEVLFALNPVTFRYKKEVDPSRALCFGLIAEDVAEISPELITRDDEGNPQTVRYDAINAMLLNEFLKQHRKVQGIEAIVAQQRKEFEATFVQQEKEIKTITATLRQQTAQIQKVSARLEASKPAPQVVAHQ